MTMKEHICVVGHAAAEVLDDQSEDHPGFVEIPAGAHWFIILVKQNWCVFIVC